MGYLKTFFAMAVAFGYFAGALAHADSSSKDPNQVDQELEGLKVKGDDTKTDTVEILLRLLLDVGDQTFKQENDHCNLGSVYLKRMNPMAYNPVKINEPFIGALAEMASGGKNQISGSCKAANCNLNLSHRNGDDVSSTVYKFTIVNGEAVVDTLTCASTP